MKLSLLFCIVSLMSFKVYANDNSNRGVVNGVLRILTEYPDAIVKWEEEKVYFSPENVVITEAGAFIFTTECSAVFIPAYSVDTYGIFALCKKEEVCQEAKEHYGKAADKLVEAIQHSTAAGLTIQIPPVAILEGYQAVEAWKEAAREYNAGIKAERESNNAAASSESYSYTQEAQNRGGGAND